MSSAANAHHDSASPSPMPPHILLFTDPVGGNAGELHALARALAYAIPEASFSFLANQEILLSLPQGALNLRLITFEHGIPNAQFSAVFFQRFLAAGPHIYDRMLKSAAMVAGRPVTCVISDAFTWIAESVPKGKMLPWIAFYSGCPLAMFAHVLTDLFISSYGTNEGRATLSQEPLNYIPGFSTMRVCDLPNGIVFHMDNAFHVKGMRKILPKADMVVVPSLSGFPEQASFGFAGLNRALPIGPLNLLSPPPPSSDTEECLQWLDLRPALSVVYICFDGYMTNTLPSKELSEVAHGLVESHVPFLWSIKEEHRSCLPDRFVERTHEIGKLVSLAPQLSVLNHPAVAVFVTRSGWKEALESISAGVPMLCRGFHGDGKMVAKALEDIWSAGVNFDGPIDRWWFVIAMKAIVGGSEGQRMRERARALRDLTMEAMAPDGSLSNNFDNLVKFIRGRTEF